MISPCLLMITKYFFVQTLYIFYIQIYIHIHAVHVTFSKESKRRVFEHGINSLVDFVTSENSLEIF